VPLLEEIAMKITKVLAATVALLASTAAGFAADLPV
jgi:hypothetical protein